MTDYSQFEKHLETLRKAVYTERKWGYHEKIIDNAFRHFVENGSFKNVLDVGFGTGYSLEKFRKLGIDPVGITLDSNELQNALFLKYEAYLMDMAFLDFPDASFDLVWCRHALEHSVMPLIALMEFGRVLKPDGKMYVEVPSDNIIHMENVNHYSMFSDEAWQMLFRKAGFFLTYRGQFAAQIKPSDQNDGYMDIYWYYWLRKA